MYRKQTSKAVKGRSWRVYDDITGLPSTNKDLHLLGKYTGLEGLYTEMDIKPSMGLAPFICPQEQPADRTKNLELPLEDFTAITLVDFDTTDPMSS